MNRLRFLWDISVFFLALSIGSGVEGAENSVGDEGWTVWLAPVVMVTPNCLYTWYLLRRVQRRELEREGVVAD